MWRKRNRYLLINVSKLQKAEAHAGENWKQELSLILQCVHF